MSNFGFLRAEWPELFEEAERAERNAVADPRTACFYARRCLEHTLKWLYRADGTLRSAYRRSSVVPAANAASTCSRTALTSCGPHWPASEIVATDFSTDIRSAVNEDSAGTMRTRTLISP